MYSHIIMNTIRIPLHGMQCLDGWNYMYSISLLCTIITVVPEANRDHLRLLYYMCMCMYSTCTCTCIQGHYNRVSGGPGPRGKTLLELHVKILLIKVFRKIIFMWVEKLGYNSLSLIPPCPCMPYTYSTCCMSTLHRHLFTCDMYWWCTIIMTWY